LKEIQNSTAVVPLILLLPNMPAQGLEHMEITLCSSEHFSHLCMQQGQLSLDSYDYITNYVGNKQKSYKIMIIKMFAILDKAKPDTESIRGLNLAAVKHTTFQVTRLPF
jgi:hypothetical protein